MAGTRAPLRAAHCHYARAGYGPCLALLHAVALHHNLTLEEYLRARPAGSDPGPLPCAVLSALLLNRPGSGCVWYQHNRRLVTRAMLYGKTPLHAFVIPTRTAPAPPPSDDKQPPSPLHWRLAQRTLIA